MSKTNRLEELLNEGALDDELLGMGFKTKEILEAKRNLENRKKIEQIEELKPEIRQIPENKVDWLIQTLEDSVDRLDQKATNPDDTRVDIQVERQIQQNIVALWKMLQDVGEIQPSKDTHFTFEIVDSIELTKEQENKEND